AGAARVAAARGLRRPRERLRRGALDGPGRRRGRRAGPGPLGLALRPLLVARRGRVRQPRPLGDAQGLRRPSGEERMTETVQPELQHENPLMEGLKLRRAPDPCALVIFGASGDLTKRKLFPALYSLALRKLLPSRFGVVGAARTEEVVRRVLRTKLDDLQELAWAGTHGAIASGMQSVAFTPVSAIAALFAATGQDLGMVGTSSMCHGAARRAEDGLQVSLRQQPGLA